MQQRFHRFHSKPDFPYIYSYAMRAHRAHSRALSQRPTKKKSFVSIAFTCIYTLHTHTLIIHIPMIAALVRLFQQPKQTNSDSACGMLLLVQQRQAKIKFWDFLPFAVSSLCAISFTSASLAIFLLLVAFFLFSRFCGGSTTVNTTQYTHISVRLLCVRLDRTFKSFVKGREEGWNSCKLIASCCIFPIVFDRIANVLFCDFDATGSWYERSPNDFFHILVEKYMQCAVCGGRIYFFVCFAFIMLLFCLELFLCKCSAAAVYYCYYFNLYFCFALNWKYILFTFVDSDEKYKCTSILTSNNK